MRRLLLLALLACFAVRATHAGESCCAKKARLAKLKFIPDESEVPPDFDAEGNPRWIPDPDEEKPEAWDDDDDGPWEPPNIANPAYAWSPRLIENPNYNPPSFLGEFWSEIRKATPWVVVGLVATAALEAVLPVHKFGALMSRCGPAGGALVGLATPLCSCGALPVAAGFVSKGVPLGAVVAFLTATQSAGLDSAAITWGLLGPLATVCRIGGALVLATAAGIAAGRGATATPSAAANGHHSHEAVGKPATASSTGRLLSLYKAAVKSATETFPPVLLGLALSTAATHWVPSLTPSANMSAYAGNAPDGADAHGGGVRSLSVRAAVLAASVPLQLCEHSTVTLAAGIQKGGGGAGLAFAFLLAAPAVNLPTLMLLLSADGHGAKDGARLPWLRGAALRVVLTLIAAALALSYGVDALALDMLVVEQEATPGAASMMDLPAPLVQASPWLAALLAAAALAHALAKRVWPPAKDEACCAKDEAPAVAPCCTTRQKAE